MYDLCIVGAGMFGSAAARHASTNPALKVVLVGPSEPKESERPSRKVFSSHYDEGRITRVVDEQIACQVLGDQSIKRYRELEKLSGIKFYKPIGLFLFGQKGNPSVEQLKQSIALGGIPTLELPDNDVVKARYPYMLVKNDEMSYLDENGAGHISPRKLVAAQQKIATLQGCAIVHDVVTEVTSLKESGSGFCHEIHRENGLPILAKRVIVAAGSFTNFLPLVPNEENLVPDMKVILETAAMLKIPAEEADRLSNMPSLIYYGSKSSQVRSIGAYVIPAIKYPDSNFYVKIGHLTSDPSGNPPPPKTLDDVRKWYLSSGNQEVIDTHSALLKDLLPGLKVSDIGALACITCRTPSGLPYIERISPTFTLAVGGNGKGAKFSDEVGRLAAELSVYGRWNSELPQTLFNTIWKKP